MEENPRQRVCDAGVASQQVTAVPPTTAEESSVMCSMEALEPIATVPTEIQHSFQQNTVINVSETSNYNKDKNFHPVKEPVVTDSTCSTVATKNLNGVQDSVNDCLVKQVLDNTNKDNFHSQLPVSTDEETKQIVESAIPIFFPAIESEEPEHCATEKVPESECVAELSGVLRATTDDSPASTDRPLSKETFEETVNEERGVDDDEQKLEEPMDFSTGPVHSFEESPREITGVWEEFKSGNGDCFTKGCKWSPDGTCLLTNSDDHVLRIFDLPRELHCQATWPRDRTLPELSPALRMKEGGLVYDYTWYPLMSSWDPLSCCLVSTAQDSPVHMWDAFTGELRATYRAYNQVDEVEAAHCVAFDPRGEKLYCGFKNIVRIFNTALPGRTCETRRLRDVEVAESQRGIVSCIAVNPAMNNIYAVGTYLKSVGLYCEPRGAALCLASGHSGGVTHLVFSPDGTKLYSGARKDSEIICWDIRNPGTLLHTLQRKVSTNQRITFDLTPDGRYLLSGQSDGRVAVWDLLAPPVVEVGGGDPVLPTCQTFLAHNDCANGVSVHQQYPIIATASGQRHFPELSRDDSDSDNDSPLLKRRYIQRENGIKLWWAAK